MEIQGIQIQNHRPYHWLLVECIVPEQLKLYLNVSQADGEISATNAAMTTFFGCNVKDQNSKNVLPF